MFMLSYLDPPYKCYIFIANGCMLTVQYQLSSVPNWQDTYTSCPKHRCYQWTSAVLNNFALKDSTQTHTGIYANKCTVFITQWCELVVHLTEEYMQLFMMLTLIVGRLVFQQY